jgi:hypothetical protein
MVDAIAQARTMAGALRACETALQRETSPSLDGLEEPLRLLSIWAHRAGVPPEGMLIRLKRVLAQSARTLALSPAQADEVRARAVTLAIEAYFSTGPDV